MSTLDEVKKFFYVRLSLRIHPCQKQAIEEECLIITEVERAPEPGDLEKLLTPAPMTLMGIVLVQSMKQPRDEISLRLDDQEIACIHSLEIPGDY